MMRTLLAFVFAASLLGCGGTTTDVPPQLTPDQEAEILQSVEAAASSEASAPEEQ